MFFCIWHENTCIEDNWAWNQPTPSIYFRLKSRGDIAVIPFVRLFCHFIYQKRIFFCEHVTVVSVNWAIVMSSIRVSESKREREKMSVLCTFIRVYSMWYECIWLKIDFSSLGWIETETNTHTQAHAQSCALKQDYEIQIERKHVVRA